jgi:hypothetical protein
MISENSIKLSTAAPIGHDGKPRKLLDRQRDQLRQKQYSRRTEKSYV